MRSASGHPQIQLASVAQRYRLVVGNRFSNPKQGSQRKYRNRQSTNHQLTDNSSVEAKMRRMEAVLFLARDPLPSRRLSQYAKLEDGTEARTLVRKLNEWYDNSGRAFRVEEIAGGYQLLTRPQFGSWLRRLGHVTDELRLSPPAMETLAVVAYRQPVLRADIEAVRGVKCGEILRQLMEKELVKIGGRSDELGRPYLYTTTRYFLQLFGLNHIHGLPRANALRQSIQGRGTRLGRKIPNLALACELSSTPCHSLATPGWVSWGP